MSLSASIESPAGSISHIERHVALARAAIAWERFWRRLWPASGIAGAFAAFALLGVFPYLPGLLHALILLPPSVALAISSGRVFRRSVFRIGPKPHGVSSVKARCRTGRLQNAKTVWRQARATVGPKTCGARTSAPCWSETQPAEICYSMRFSCFRGPLLFALRRSGSAAARSNCCRKRCAQQT